MKVSRKSCFEPVADFKSPKLKKPAPSATAVAPPPKKKKEKPRTVTPPPTRTRTYTEYDRYVDREAKRLFNIDLTQRVCDRVDETLAQPSPAQTQPQIPRAPVEPKKKPKYRGFSEISQQVHNETRNISTPGSDSPAPDKKSKGGEAR